MNNDITNPTPENEAELTEAAELLTSDQSEPAFDYQPPAVETPEPPTVADSVPVVETKVAFSPEDAAESVPEEPVGMDDGKSAASEKTAEAPVEQPPGRTAHVTAEEGGLHACHHLSLRDA